MNLHHLKVFLAVAESGSISGGAERLHISQPAVTREVRELEARLGITLFDRQPRGVTLTEGGLRLHRYAQRIFALEQAAEADLRSFAGLDDGELRLGASATLGSYLLPDLIASFHARHPEIRVDLQVSNTREITQALADEHIALGFVEGDFDRTTHAFQLLERDRLLPVCSSTHALADRGRLAAAELAGQALYLREEGSGTRASIEQAYAQQGLEVRACMAIASTEALKRLVRDGQGIAWLSQRVIDDDLAAGRLVALEVEDLRIERELHLLWHPTRTLSPAPAAFLTAILDKK
ncbi:LysR family transcriptional regulator [Pseudomonas solani]|uniref:LysR family transcriptional regulator n=1 Tax=Pseudomonas solani TaxID=2731552 RepID=A0ABN6BQ89_9PSED|nr:LysR family transcriptional regulator [Pseudomonas solani]BCD86069.1 LysR family transcriptional regulator [Pseudomonas solani]